MDPIRTATVNGHVVHEHYWAGSYPVYVDNRLREGSFEDICAALQEAPSPDTLQSGKAA